MSQSWRSSSQKPSKRPAATQARSSAAEPKRRMPATSGETASRIRSKRVEIAMRLVGDAGGDQRLGEVAAGGDAQPALVEPGAPALLRPEALVGERLVDQAVGDLAPALAAGLRLLDRDRDGEMGDAVEEVGGAVERIDDPARLVRIALDRAAFLEQQAPVGRAWRSSSTMVCSARSSAIETKSAGPLRLTWSCSTSPKSRLSRGAALRAARVMTVMRPEWANQDTSPFMSSEVETPLERSRDENPRFARNAPRLRSGRTDFIHLVRACGRRSARRRRRRSGCRRRYAAAP